MGYGTCFWSKHLHRKVQKADIYIFLSSEESPDPQQQTENVEDQKIITRLLATDAGADFNELTHTKKITCSAYSADHWNRETWQPAFSLYIRGLLQGAKFYHQTVGKSSSQTCATEKRFELYPYCKRKSNCNQGTINFLHALPVHASWIWIPWLLFFAKCCSSPLWRAPCMNSPQGNTSERGSTPLVPQERSVKGTGRRRMSETDSKIHLPRRRELALLPRRILSSSWGNAWHGGSNISRLMKSHSVTWKPELL